MKFPSIITLIILFYLFSCERDNLNQDDPCKISHKIAVMLPISGPDKNDWKKSANWVLENIESSGCVANGHIELVWFDTYNKNNEDNYIENLSVKICENDEILAAIGPFTSTQAFQAAPIFIKYEKTLVLPVASSEEISTAFSGKKFIWRLVEADISQCQVQLIIAKNKGKKKIALVTGDDPYGITFYNWFGFLATEMKLEVTYIKKYNQETEKCDEYIKSALLSEPEILIAVPRNVDQAVSMAKVWRNSNTKSEIFFSDAAFLKGFITQLGDDANGLEGTVISSNPMTGFNNAYKDKYNVSPTLGEAQLYDAILLLAYGIELSGGKNRYELSGSLMRLADGCEGEVDWTRPGIQQTFEMLQNGKFPNITGASGELKFAKDFYTDIISSTYMHWKIDNGEFQNVEYYNSEKSNRITELGAAWQTYANTIQTFDTLNINVKHNKELRVLIVATSKGWSNYRHQADALKMYQILKKNGLDDDHIILIMEDDISRNTRNPKQNVILDPLTGDNLYSDIKIDYKFNNLDAASFLDILANLTSSSENPSECNILLYISGHGNSEGLFDEENKSFITPTLLKSTLNNMHKNNKYLRLLCIIESCYSGVFEASNDADQSSLFLTAANAVEASKAANYNTEIEAWISSKFSYELFKQIDNGKSLFFSDLYINLLKSVNGSHICMFRSLNFGDIHKTTIDEFLKNPY